MKRLFDKLIEDAAGDNSLGIEDLELQGYRITATPGGTISILLYNDGTYTIDPISKENKE